MSSLLSPLKFSASRALVGLRDRDCGEYNFFKIPL